MSITTEIVTFNTIASIEKEEFIAIVNELEKMYHSKQEGFIDSELLFDKKTNQWLIIQHWSSLENLRAASSKMFNNPLTEIFVKSLDPKSVKMQMLSQLGVWNNEAV